MGSLEPVRGRIADWKRTEAGIPETGWDAADLTAELRNAIGASSRIHKKLDYLQGLQDQKLLAWGLLQLAQAEQARENFPAAGKVYQFLAQQTWVPAGVQAKARHQLEIFGGGGSIGERLEFRGAPLLKEILHPAGIGGMIGGALAFRYGRWAALRWLESGSATATWQGWRLSAAGTAAGFALEIPTFTFTAKGLSELTGHSQDWSGKAILSDLAHGAILLGSLRLSGMGTRFAAQKWAAGSGSLSKFSQIAFPQSGMLAGIMGGTLLQQKMGLAPETDGTSFVLNSLVSLFQFNVAGNLAHRMTPRLSFDQRKNLPTDLSKIDGTNEGLIKPTKGQLAWATSAGGYSSQMASSSAKTAPAPLAAQMVPVRDPSNLASLEALKAKYRKIFAERGNSPYAESIIQEALELSLPIQGKERVLKTLSESDFLTSGEKRDIVSSVKVIYELDPLNSSIGSIENLFLHYALHEAFSHGSNKISIAQLNAIFSEMKSGWSRGSTIRLYSEHGMGRDTALKASEPLPAKFLKNYETQFNNSLKVYRSQDLSLLKKYFYWLSKKSPSSIDGYLQAWGQARTERWYDPRLVDEVLDYARRHPQSALILNRMSQIFADRDVPAKLREIIPDQTPQDTQKYVQQLEELGLTRDEMAFSLNGTKHTGYLQDLRLAYKVVDVMQEANDFILNKSELIPQRHERLVNRIKDYLRYQNRSGRKLEANNLISFLRVVPTRLTELILAAPKSKLVIEVVTKEELTKINKKLGETDDCQFSLFRQTKNGEPDRIYIRAPEVLDVRQSHLMDQAVNDIIDILGFLVHEGEHWRQTQLQYVEGGPPLRLRNGLRGDRLVSEIMAELEENNLAMTSLKNYKYRLPDMLGTSLVHYSRNSGDFTYFGKGNPRRNHR